MNENLKKFAEWISAQDEETKEKVSRMEESGLIALAAENGIPLTAQELAEAKKQEEESGTTQDGELSDDELSAVAGGVEARCFIYGEDAIEIKWDRDKCPCDGYGVGNHRG